MFKNLFNKIKHMFNNFILSLIYKYNIKILRSGYNVCIYDVVINNIDSFVVEFSRNDEKEFYMRIYVYNSKYIKNKIGMILLKKIVTDVINNFMYSRINVKKIIIVNNSIIDNDFVNFLKMSIKKNIIYKQKNPKIEKNIIVFN